MIETSILNSELLQFPDHPFLSPHPPHVIPAWLPFFPPRHTWAATPVYPVPTTDPRAFVASRAKRQREASVALAELGQKLAASRAGPRTAFDKATTVSNFSDEFSLLAPPLPPSAADPSAPPSPPEQPIENPFLPAKIGRTQHFARPEPVPLLPTSLIPYLKYAEDPSRAVKLADAQLHTRVLTKGYSLPERLRRTNRVEQILNTSI